ncbi:hypothetical protein [Gilvibacter sp.]|uniref:hypothetical protein n=1 Tax=Gilvibacter sp. TaxID=2729997 RepID=UPI003F4A3CBD
MKGSYFLLFLLVTALYSCDEQKLGDGYFYLPKYEAVDIGYPEQEAIIYKSDQQYSFNEVIIRGDVVAVKSDERFIIAKRDSLLHNGQNLGREDFFIVLKEQDSVLGPLSESSFEKTLIELKINLNLK